MENKQVEKFDPSTLMQGVKDRIKSTFVSLIPDDQWESMVKKEIKDYFFKEEEIYSNRERKTRFHTLVRETLTQECRDRLKTYLTGPDFQNTWDNNGKQQTADAVEKMIVENSGAIMTNMFAGMFQGMLQNFANQMRT